MFESLIAYQIIAGLSGGVEALLLCSVLRRIRRRQTGFTATDLLLAMIVQIPAGMLLLLLGYIAFAKFESSMAFFLMVGTVFYAGFFWFPLAGLRFALNRRNLVGRSPLPRVSVPMRLLFLSYVLIAFSLGFYAWFIEPSEIEISEHHLTSKRWTASTRPLRIVHLSDLQTSYLGSREIQVGPIVEELAPDLILFSGDLFTRALYGDGPQQSARTVLGRISAPFGFFGVTGDSETPKQAKELLDAFSMSLLRNEIRRLNVRGQELIIIGLDRKNPDYGLVSGPFPEEAVVIVVAHSPDVILGMGYDPHSTGEKPSLRPDLILAGHTHGGQIVLPWVGAPVTFTKLGTRFASGLFHLGESVLHISRGLGMEGHFAPRVRFLCPPEITLLQITSDHDSPSDPEAIPHPGPKGS